MLPGVYQAKKKDGSIYYRSNITCRGKHISLGSFAEERLAHCAYIEAKSLFYTARGDVTTIDNISFSDYSLHFEKIITLLNFRDNQIYIKNPIYLHRTYFCYYLTLQDIYKFDIDDLFYYSGHKLLKRGGHLYVNDYGMQVNVLSRYGIRNFAVAGKDYMFANQDPYDLRYANIININPYHGVRRCKEGKMAGYEAYIHIRGDFKVGTYKTVQEAAIAYNKAADLAHRHGIMKKFPTNYLAELSPRDYAQAYIQTAVSEKYTNFLHSMDDTFP